jgi:large subunit ribosomal protein L13
MDMGAYVIVINAEQVAVSGNKAQDKVYFNQHYTGRPGSGRLEKFKDLQAVSGRDFQD